MTTKLTKDNLSNLKNFSVSWQAVKTTDFTAVAGEGYFVNTTSGAVTVTLPASATIGDIIQIKDYAGTFATNKLTIARNGHNIQGVANDSLISTNRASISLFYVDSTKGWLYKDESNVADLKLNPFIEATGGTVSTSGDYKIHSFTGDGCFVVSNIGPGSSSVDYLVVAGGGGGSYGGGGGAGGFRESSGATSGCYTRSSLGACVSALPVSATTYPVTVGGGGSSNANGSNSIFSTITSTGGGRGNWGLCGASGNPGGSGGGAGGDTGVPDAGGAGNTPPVSPPQGNPGGNHDINYKGGGGGGAGAAGTTWSPGTPLLHGPGGVGLSTSISGSSVFYAGGGGGSGDGGSGGGDTSLGGNGGGGPGQYANGTAGTANTGGGGGSGYAGSGAAGGKGIIIIRYKYQ